MNKVEEEKLCFVLDYLTMLHHFLIALKKIHNYKQILRTMIQPCFHLITTTSTNTLLCAEKTLGLCLFVYFDSDLGNMKKCIMKEL